MTRSRFFKLAAAAPDRSSGVGSADAASWISRARPGLWSYALAMVLSLGMLAIREQMAVHFGDRPLLILFVLPIAVSAMVGGAGPGILATLLSSLGVNYLAIAPVKSFEIRSGVDLVLWLIFLFNGVLIAVLAEVLRRSLLRAQNDRALLQAVLESTPDAISVKDREGRYLLVNRTLTQSLGIPAERIIGRRASDIMPAAEAAELDAHERAALAAGRPLTSEQTVTTTNGLRHFRSTRGPVFGRGGELVGIFGMSRDITEQRAAAAAQARSEARLSLTLDALREGLWDLDVRSGRAFRSPRTYELLDRDAADDSGDFAFFASSVHADDLPQLQHAFDAHLRSETALFEHEFRLRSQRFADRWLSVRGRVVERDADGAPLRVLGTLTDVSERRQSDAAIQRQQAQLTGIIDSAMDAIVMIDAGQRIALFNPAAETMFGRRSAEMLGEPLTLLLPQAARATHSSDILAFGTAGEATRRMGGARPITGLRADGSSFPIEASIARLEANGQRYYTAILRDVSQRQIDQQARSDAESANRTKSSFLANMSHEIRTPMNAIIGLTHLLRRASPTVEQAQRLDKIGVAGKHLLSIINDILDISKIEAGQVRLESTDFHLSSILDNVRSIIAEPAQLKGLQVTIDPDGVPLWLCGDPTRLRQALLNYASNAVKFTERGSIAIRAVLLQDDGHSLQVRFEVQDTGIGISHESQQRLFVEFEQADASTTRQYGGSGLGLAITRRLAGLMHGEAGMYSQPGVGSTFWFTVRLSRGHGVVPVAAGAVMDDAELELRQRFAGTPVLLVEDNEVNREVALELLHGVGLAVDTAEDGAQAVEKARASAYEMILMDMQMPVMDGVTATQIIRALPDWSTRPILAMTANAFNEDRDKCRRAGMNDFIVKPVDPQALYRMLLQWMPRHGAPRVPLPPAPAASPPTSPAGAPGQSSGQTGGAALASLAGVDTALGLKVMRGDVQRYAQLLERFAVASTAEVDALAAAVQAGDIAAAKRLAHSLRGGAGAVGAVELAAAVSALEACWADATAAQDAPATLEWLQALHARLVAAIRELPRLLSM